MNEKAQREKAEEWIDQKLIHMPHEDGERVRVMNPQCQEAFDTALAHAKDPHYALIAWICIERAKGMVEALVMSGLIDSQTYKAYRAQISAAGLVVSAAEMQL